MEEVKFKKNVDFFELKEGTYYTLDALRRKYKCSDWHIGRKVKEFNIDKESIMGKIVYKDDIRYEKYHNTNGKKVGGKPTITYVELRNSVDALMLAVKENMNVNEVRILKMQSTLEEILNHLTKGENNGIG